MVFSKSVKLMDEFYYSDNVPPIIKFIVTPIIIIWWILAAITGIFLWLIGFWECYECEKSFPFWVKNKPYYAGGSLEDGPSKYNCCLKCRKGVKIK